MVRVVYGKSFSPLKTVTSLERIRFIDSARERPLGSWSRGSVYHAKAWFKGSEKGKRVAIKIFNDPLTEEDARFFQFGLNRLRKHRVLLPPMGIVKIPLEELERAGIAPRNASIAELRAKGEDGVYALVERSFSSVTKPTRVSEIVSRFLDETAQKQALTQYVRIGNAGFTVANDVLVKKTNSGGVTRVFPLDMEVVFLKFNASPLFPFKPQPNERLAVQIVQRIQDMGSDGVKARRLLTGNHRQSSLPMGRKIVLPKTPAP